jgi:hypothetical protein
VRPARAAGKLLAVLLAAGIGAGCGVQPSGIITGRQAPTLPAAGMPLYFMAHGHLTVVVHPVAPRPTPSGALTALAHGPTQGERALGYSSEVPRDLRLGTIRPGPAGTTVGLSRDVATLSSTAVDQIVCTLAGVTTPAAGSTGRRAAPLTLTGHGHSRGPHVCPLPLPG